jgi:hypothetical protein
VGSERTTNKLQIVFITLGRFVAVVVSPVILALIPGVAVRESKIIDLGRLSCLEEGGGEVDE